MTFIPLTPKKTRKRREEPEFLEQSALFEWARNPAVLAKHPALKLMSSSLNGVKLSKAQAGKAKAAGMLKGEWDVKLPVPRGGHTGLIIEMKAGRNTLTDEQKDYQRDMRAEGWATAVCYSWTEAKDEIVDYLARGGSIPQPLVKK